MIEGHCLGSYTQRKNCSSGDLHGGGFFCGSRRGIPAYMDRKATYIRAWRKERGYTLDDMVGRLEVLGVKTTGATLSRIETGKVPYSQDILEAIAEALDVTVAQLIEHNPDIPTSPVAGIFDKLDAEQAAQAEAVLRAMFAKSA